MIFPRLIIITQQYGTFTFVGVLSRLDDIHERRPSLSFLLFCFLPHCVQKALLPASPSNNSFSVNANRRAIYMRKTYENYPTIYFLRSTHDKTGPIFRWNFVSPLYDRSSLYSAAWLGQAPSFLCGVT